MKTLEEIFIQEFKESTIPLKEDIFSVPLPQECSKWNVLKEDIFAVKGIPKDNPFFGLNKSFVFELPKGTVAKRRVIDRVTRSFKRDSNDKFVYEDYKVPSGSMVVTSKCNLQLSYKTYINPPEGYGYIDFVVNKGEKVYMYVLPKEVIYKCHPTALVLSNAGMSKRSGSKLKTYNGERYKTWKCGTVGLLVIPYNPKKQYTNTIVLKTSFSLNYQEDIEKIKSFWESIGFIPVTSCCYIQDGTNLCYTDDIPSYNEYSYVDLLPISTKEIYGSNGEIDKKQTKY